MSEKLKIAIQKSGRLHESSLRLLKECGISFDNGNDHLKIQANNFPLEILFLRNSDIPQYVEDGVADIAIIGQNLIIEKDKKIEEIRKLGFSKCRLSLAVPKNMKYPGLAWFNGRKIATSYPNTLKKFLDKNNIRVEIHEISGSVEIAPNIGLADGICDLVSSGSTLFKNGLKEVEIILESEACLAAKIDVDAKKKILLDKLIFRIKAVLTSRNNKYVLLNAPDKKLDTIKRIIPGIKSPTIMPLAEKGWSSVHSVINENDFWEIIDQLKENGAQGILIIPIEKMIV